MICALTSADHACPLGRRPTDPFRPIYRKAERQLVMCSQIGAEQVRWVRHTWRHVSTMRTGRSRYQPSKHSTYVQRLHVHMSQVPHRSTVLLQCAGGKTLPRRSKHQRKDVRLISKDAFYPGLRTLTGACFRRYSASSRRRGIAKQVYSYS